MERGHMQDWELVAALSGEGTAPERAHWQRHLGECTDCAQAADELKRRRTRITRALAQLPHEPPARLRDARTVLAAAEADARRVSRYDENAGAARGPHTGGEAGARHRYLARAAVITVALGGVLAVQPVRAWLQQLLATTFATEPAAAPAPGTEPPPLVQAAAPSAVRFRPEGDALTIEISAAQRAGTLTLRRTAADHVALLLPADAAGVVPVLGGSTLRVRTAADVDASYVIELPPFVRRVDLRIGESRVQTLLAAELDAGVAIDLARR